MQQRNRRSVKRALLTHFSGGCHSCQASLVAALVNEFMSKKGIQIETYSIGLKGSEDLKVPLTNFPSFENSSKLTLGLELMDLLKRARGLNALIEIEDNTELTSSLIILFFFFNVFKTFSGFVL